jgi:hypothetical protein
LKNIDLIITYTESLKILLYQAKNEGFNIINKNKFLIVIKNLNNLLKNNINKEIKLNDLDSFDIDNTLNIFLSLSTKLNFYILGNEDISIEEEYFYINELINLLNIENIKKTKS